MIVRMNVSYAIWPTWSVVICVFPAPTSNYHLHNHHPLTKRKKAEITELGVGNDDVTKQNKTKQRQGPQISSPRFSTTTEGKPTAVGQIPSAACKFGFLDLPSSPGVLFCFVYVDAKKRKNTDDLNPT